MQIVSLSQRTTYCYPLTEEPMPCIIGAGPHSVAMFYVAHRQLLSVHLRCLAGEVLKAIRHQMKI
jgi:hypothetical protein